MSVYSGPDILNQSVIPVHEPGQLLPVGMGNLIEFLGFPGRDIVIVFFFPQLVAAFQKGPVCFIKRQTDQECGGFAVRANQPAAVEGIIIKFSQGCVFIDGGVFQGFDIFLICQISQ